LAALWNGNSAKAFTWENISMSVQDKSGYLVRAGSNGAVQWAHQIQNGSAAILTVDDLGASVLRISRAGAASGSSPVTMDGTQLIPPGTDALGCTLAQVSPAGSINWVKRIKTCSDGNIRWALSPTSQELHVVSKANVDWGDGAATQSTLEHVLTKLDTSGNVAWHQSVVTFSSNITSYGYPWLIVADNDIPMVYGYLEKTISFGGNTLTNQAGKDGVFIEAFEKTGAPRWLNGFTDCSKVDSAWFSPLARVHGKVALGVVVSSCTVNGTSIATPINNLYAFTSNLVVITP
jgi:hypothetical protein